MLYYLASLLTPSIGAFNVLLYHTVRAGGAALTGFIVCLLVGPWFIRRLQALKIGQFIKKDHVADLHALHKGKAGTPTMGGTMMLFSTCFTLLLWGRLSNRLLWLALGVFVMLGIVGFMDDYIKLRRKHNDGLSARAKFAGQILTGSFLGLYLFFNPITTSATYVQPRDVISWYQLEAALTVHEEAALQNVWGHFSTDVQELLENVGASGRLSAGGRSLVLQEINQSLDDPGLFPEAVLAKLPMTDEAAGLQARGLDTISAREVIRFNRLMLESALADIIADSQPNMHTKVGVPGMKNIYIQLGFLYAIFVVLILVSISNAVNLTDGLDGLAAGTSVISIMAYAAIAYVVSRADWSHYLYLTYVPEASELFVFGSALLGTGLGFLWFNGHPAEVFMGDTGSLALGGALGSLAILTKQELLLPLVAGLFVLEAGSVVIQVASYKLTGKRVFRMAPLHHHFELLGWTETKVTLRFWIVALLFALMSLATLKLR